MNIDFFPATQKKKKKEKKKKEKKKKERKKREKSGVSQKYRLSFFAYCHEICFNYVFDFSG